MSDASLSAHLKKHCRFIALSVLLIACIIWASFLNFNSIPKHLNNRWIQTESAKSTILILNNSNLLSAFPEYKGCDGKTHIELRLVASRGSVIHRFFDSSPFSPSGRYLVVTRALITEEVAVQPGDEAEIVVIDLRNGREHIVAKTSAWDAQTGAQAQWGHNDGQLFYNSLCSDLNCNSSRQNAHGVMHNIFSGEKKSLQCPIYHVSSSGKYAISPDLSKIKFSQLGYGYHSKLASKNSDATSLDGIYLIDIDTGRCILWKSLREIALAGNLDINSPTYGFHTKWSSDGNFVMFVVRTLDLEAGYRGQLMGKRGRCQHLFVLQLDTSRARKDDDTGIRKLITWCSKKVAAKHLESIDCCDSSSFPEPSPYEFSCEAHSSITDGNHLESRSYSESSVEKAKQRPTGDNRLQHRLRKDQQHRDGNHPNWIPGTHKISMNLQSCLDAASSTSSPSGVNIGPANNPRNSLDGEDLEQGNPSSFWDRLLSKQTWVASVLGITPQEAQRTFDRRWGLSVFDIDELFADDPRNGLADTAVYSNSSSSSNNVESSQLLPPSLATSKLIPKEMTVISHESQKIYNGRDSREDESSSRAKLAKSQCARTCGLERQVYGRGSGHPNFSPADGGRYVVMDAYAKERHWFAGLRDRCVPLRLVDTHTGREVWLAQIPVERNSSSRSAKDGKETAVSRSWRCDVHPAWSRDYRYLALNARTTGGDRQVLVAYVGDNLASFFAEKE